MGIRCVSGEKPCGSFQKVGRGASGAGSPGENAPESVCRPAQPTGVHTGCIVTSCLCHHVSWPSQEMWMMTFVSLQTQGPFLIFRVSERGGQISLEILSPVYYHRMKQCFFLFQCS